MGQAIPFRTERMYAPRVTRKAEAVRNMHLMSITLGGLVGVCAPDAMTGALMGVATVKSIEFAAKQVALLGIALWVNK